MIRIGHIYGGAGNSGFCLSLLWLLDFSRLFSPNGLQGFRHLLDEGARSLQLLCRQAVQVLQSQEDEVRAGRRDQGGSQSFEAGVGSNLGSLGNNFVTAETLVKEEA